MTSASVIIETIDHCFHVLPRNVVRYWDYFRSIAEAGCMTIDDVIPVPLTSQQFDKWIEFVILFESGYTERLGYSTEENSEIIPARAVEYETLIRTMDFNDDIWMLYVVRNEGSDIELLDWYFRVGTRVHNDISEYNSGEDIGNRFSVLRKEWLKYLVEQIYILSQTTDRKRECIILLGIIYNGWLESYCPTKLLWHHVDWRMIMRLKLSHIVDLARFPKTQHTCTISHSVEMLCYDGEVVDYGYCCDYIPTDSGSGFVEFKDITLSLQQFGDLYCRIMRFCIDRVRRSGNTIDSETMGELLGLNINGGVLNKTAHIGIIQNINTKVLFMYSPRGRISHNGLVHYMGTQCYNLLKEAQLLKLEKMTEEWKK